MERKKTQRVVVYIPEDEYKQLRAKLILVGTTVSAWVRKIIRDFLRNE